MNSEIPSLHMVITTWPPVRFFDASKTYAADLVTRMGRGMEILEGLKTRKCMMSNVASELIEINQYMILNIKAHGVLVDMAFGTNSIDTITALKYLAYLKVDRVMAQGFIDYQEEVFDEVGSLDDYTG